jgi:hypothetical protein
MPGSRDQPSGMALSIRQLHAAGTVYSHRHSFSFYWPITWYKAFIRNILSHPGPQPQPCLNSQQVRDGDGDGEYDTYHELSVTGIKVGSRADPASFAFCVINGIGPCFLAV